ncbi:hypothetical protein V5799_016982 [Amblyomma americanum]|uniref:Uncharacterized protein n=1 Tax=Amblyomma americanum TaxID=6943 RepID=A0AAQ4F3J4_AMBAM
MTDPRFDPRMNPLADWSDLMAVRAGREVLMGLKYPADETRRSLYASWLRVLASNQWHDSFDGLMLECLAATPSPTTPEQPLFANMYSVRHPADGPIPDILASVLNLGQLPDLFTDEREPVEPLPTSAGFVDYLADLIRKGGTSRAALDEAGLIIGFCSLALAVAASKPPKEVRAFFRHRLKRALVAAVPTSFNGDMFIPRNRFLCKLALKSVYDSGVIKPFFVLLVLGQYAYHLNAEAAPRFLEEGFLNKTKYGRLEVVRLLYAVQKQSGLDAKELNRLIRSYGALRSIAQSSSVVAAFLDHAEEPMQKTRPWCLAPNPSACLDLDLCDHLDYAVRLTALLAPHPQHKLWRRPEFAGVSMSRIKESLLWARVFRRYVSK